jgi:hypothetical protein
MKEITIKIPDDIYSELKTAANVRKMTGASYGLIDGFIIGLLRKIKEGCTEWEVRYKNEKD